MITLRRTFFRRTFFHRIFRTRINPVPTLGKVKFAKENTPRQQKPYLFAVKFALFRGTVNFGNA